MKNLYFLLFLVYVLGFTASVLSLEVCGLSFDNLTQCNSSQFAFIEGGLQVGQAVKISAVLSPSATFEVSNSGFQSIAYVHFGSNSFSLESGISPIRTYASYPNGAVSVGSVISFYLVALENSIAIYFEDSKLAEIPLLIAGPYMVANPINQPIPTFELVNHKATKSSFCVIKSDSESCSQSSMVSFKEGASDNLTITTNLPSTVPEDFFSFSISGYSSVYDIPEFQLATTSNKFYVAVNGVMKTTGNLPSSVKLGNELITHMKKVTGTDTYHIMLNSVVISELTLTKKIYFIFQGVSQGTMSVTTK
ncbi:hypothetical protein cand_006000 [Cryptosporidium andersoni]|uniref:Uncharacterized protein n=1 Tax=Cryptosporidium andersoni TaxID=117008 RepID=A0A1J4MPL3_9CRYT|nr:hypothetical protein cand_006000 [Cryptosporidium andersoni]